MNLLDDECFKKIKKQVEEDQEFRRQNGICPRPANGRPAYLTKDDCVKFNECGCGHIIDEQP